MTHMTKEQRNALKKLFNRDRPEQEYPCIAYYEPRSYLRFRRTVEPGPGCAMVPWAGIWYGIEPDGYTHT
jgi:hypothetical protein